MRGADDGGLGPGRGQPAGPAGEGVGGTGALAQRPRQHGVHAQRRLRQDLAQRPGRGHHVEGVVHVHDAALPVANQHRSHVHALVGGDEVHALGHRQVEQVGQRMFVIPGFDRCFRPRQIGRLLPVACGAVKRRRGEQRVHVLHVHRVEGMHVHDGVDLFAIAGKRQQFSALGVVEVAAIDDDETAIATLYHRHMRADVDANHAERAADVPESISQFLHGAWPPGAKANRAAESAGALRSGPWPTAGGCL